MHTVYLPATGAEPLGAGDGAHGADPVSRRLGVNQQSPNLSGRSPGGDRGVCVCIAEYLELS